MMRGQAMKNLVEKVSHIQKNLKAPKGQENKFGNYKYRNCEDILEAVKPLLNGLLLTISDDVVMVGDRVYVKATVTITDGENSIVNQAFARESAIKKGMDDSQITGATSSYARKYALNGLFCIDDTKDADSFDNRTAKQVDESYVRATKKLLESFEAWTPIELWSYFEKCRALDEDLYIYLYNQFPDKQKVSGKAKVVEGGKMVTGYIDIFKGNDESAIEEATEELTESELKIINSIKDKRA